jgi:DeoR family transcriptional regulator, fructose operon transcriptional repressor
MSKTKHRQEKIRQLLAAKGRLGVGEIVRQMNVVAMTIRRDLAAMERAGILTRTHGGCVLHSPFVSDLSFPEKARRRQIQKTAIAREIASLLRPGDSIYLDTGTTALQVARALPPGLDLKVFTNNLRVAMELFDRAGVQVTVYGGLLAKKNPDLVSEMAVAQVLQYRLDVAIIGGDALDVRRGEFYGADAATVALSRAAQAQAERLIVAVDSSKIGKRGIALVGRLDSGMTLVTDDEVAKADRAALRQTNATLIFART